MFNNTADRGVLNHIVRLRSNAPYEVNISANVKHAIVAAMATLNSIPQPDDAGTTVVEDASATAIEGGSVDEGPSYEDERAALEGVLNAMR
jgi:hypothetical protein